MLPLLIATALAGSAPTAPPPPQGLAPGIDAGRERARDAGATLRRVQELRDAGEYQTAADELAGYCERWRATGLGRPEVAAELARMEALLRRMVELRDLYQRAPHDPSAAGEYLRALIDPARPSSITVERARGIRLLARHDERVRALLERTFPARLEVTVHNHADEELKDVVGIPLENALADMSRQTGLALSADGGPTSLRVEVFVRENDRRHSILEGTAMRSWAFHMSARLLDADGERLLDAAQSTSGLGINPGNAARWNHERCAQLIFERIVEELAKRIERGQL